MALIRWCSPHIMLCRALYHCNYCQRDISDNIRIKCAVCADFDLCVECFSVGVEINGHSNDHSYKVMDNLCFPIFHPSWGVSDTGAVGKRGGIFQAQFSHMSHTAIPTRLTEDSHHTDTTLSRCVRQCACYSGLAAYIVAARCGLQPFRQNTQR
jgi:hypothetical protein